MSTAADELQSFDRKVRRTFHLFAEGKAKSLINDSALDKSVEINGEFDSGSERTLAAWIRHASRTRFRLLAITI